MESQIPFSDGVGKQKNEIRSSDSVFPHRRKTVGTKVHASMQNTCSSSTVPTKWVNLSANRFPVMWENGIRTSSFVFRSPTPSEKGI